MPSTTPDLAQLLKDFPILATVVIGLVGLVFNWVRGRFTAYETRLVQSQEKADLLVRQLKSEHRQEVQRLQAEHRQDRRDWEQRERDLEDDLGRVRAQVAQMARIPPTALDDLRPRRPRRPAPADPDEVP